MRLFFDVDWSQRYVYTSDLLCLEFCRPILPRHIPEVLVGVSTSLIVTPWRKALASHPDHAFARYVIQGLQEGFRIGFRYPSPLCSATENMPLAVQHPQVMNDYIPKELSLGHFLGPFPSFPAVHLNRFGGHPKRWQHREMEVNH